MRGLEKRVEKFATREAADRAYRRLLTPEERLDMLVERGDRGAAEGLARVYRIIKLRER